MPQSYFKTVFVVLVFLATLFTTALSANAETVTKVPTHVITTHVVTIKVGDSKGGCHHWEVVLNGYQASKNCKDVSGSKQISPNTYINCSNPAVIVWFNSNFNGDTICFKGQGFANLTDYCTSYCIFSWNDNASSYESFCPYAADGAYYIDINGNGKKQPYGLYGVSQGNFNGSYSGSIGILPNDSLSSIQITSYCGL